MKFKKMTLFILLIVCICLLLTGIILFRWIKPKEKEELLVKESYWFFQQAVETGQPVCLENAYIISCENGKLVFLYDHITYEVEGNLEENYFGIADIQIEGNQISRLRMKPDSIKGVLQAYTEQTLNVKEMGEKPRNASVPVYKLTEGQVTQTEWNQMIIGVSQIRCIMENGVVCSVILEEDVVPSDIRVVIKNGEDIYYPDLHIKKVSDGSLLHANAYMASAGVESFVLEDAQGLLLCDSTGNPIEIAYEGSLRVIKDAQGLVLVNELPIETYIKYVLPSEMPRTFSQEALKAQAVCARTYTYSHMNNQTYAAYGANLDDSTNFQAFHNTERCAETDAAVDETAGEIVTCNGELISCYYYSTSPGVTNDMSSWEGENMDYISCAGMEFSGGLNLMEEADFSQFMLRESASYDSASSFYRWKAVLDISNIKEASKGALRSITVKQRNQAGYIIQLELNYENTTEVLQNENRIRKLLGKYLSEVVLQNEQIRTDLSMLPSACFEVLQAEDGKILLRGGGFGHGIGMSQYGAKGMAEAGHTYKEIIEYYYENVVVKKLS